MSGALIAAYGAAAIALASGAFGVGVARMFWAEDLHHAKNIDDIRSGAAAHLKSTVEAQARSIESQGRTIDALIETITIQKRRLGDAP